LTAVWGAALRAEDAAAPGAGEDKKTEHGAKAHPTKYVATVHKKDGGAEDLKLDLNNPEHAAKLTELLKHGQVEELKQEKETNLLELRWDLGLWTLVVFLLLLFILSKVAWKPMLEGLHKREESIRSAVEEAKLARAESERLRAEFQKEMAKAYEQIPQMLDQARRDAHTLQEEMRAKAQEDIQIERQRLRREIETARDQALQELWNQTAQLATLISAKALQREVSPEDHRRLVDEALRDLPRSGQEWKRKEGDGQG